MPRKPCPGEIPNVKWPPPIPKSNQSQIVEPTPPRPTCPKGQ